MTTKRPPLSYDMDEPMPLQHVDWTCSACSLAWMNRALAIGRGTTELSATELIGVPEHITPAWGLMDGSGARLAELLRQDGAPAFTCWPSWSQAVHLAVVTPMLIGGANWNHWVGVRTSDQNTLLLANSAPGWYGIDQELTEVEWEQLGPFAAVIVPLLRNLPPPPSA